MKGTNESILAQIMALDPSTAVFTGADAPGTDEVVGVLSDDLKRIWIFLEATSQKSREALTPLIEELKKLNDEHEKAHESGNHSAEDCEKFRKKAEPLKDEVDKIRFAHKKASEFFWAAVYLDFGLTEGTTLSIREGGVVVKTAPQQNDGLASLLGRIGITLARA